MRILTLSRIGSNDAADETKAKMKTYILRTDASQTEVQANSAQEALKAAKITKAMIADGGWAWAEAKDGSEERQYIARENMG